MTSWVVLKICLAFLAWLIIYSVFILRPQVRELERKLALPEFQGTAHYQTMAFSLKRFHRRSVRIYLLILILGVLTLGLVPWLPR